MDRRRTERLRPLVPPAVEPRQVLQRDPAALQKQYAIPSWMADITAPLLMRRAGMKNVRISNRQNL